MNFRGIFFYPLLFSLTLFAQWEQDSIFLSSANPQTNELVSEYRKQLNAHDFFGNAKYSLTAQDYSVNVFEDYHSNIIYSAQRSTRETHKFRAAAAYRVYGDLFLGSDGLVKSYSDSRNTGLNKAAAKSAELFLLHRPSESVKTKFSTGIIGSTQMGIADNGYIFDLQSSANSLSLFESNVSAMLGLRRENLSVRQNNDDRAQIRIENNLPGIFENEFSIEYENQRNDFYLPAESVIQQQFFTQVNAQQREETAYNLVNNLKKFILVPGSLSAGARIALWERNILRRYLYMPAVYSESSLTPDRIDENRVEVNGNLRWEASRIVTLLTGAFYQAAEKHSLLNRQNYPQYAYEERSSIESLKNNSLRRISIGISTELSFDRITAGCILTHNKLQYDTPSTDNSDDRDELLSILKLYSQISVTDFFKILAAVEGNASKLSYLFKERSANNFSNRVLKLTLGGKLNSPAIVSSNIFEISSFYTVYDFDGLNTAVKSFSFRQISFHDSTRIPLSGKISFELRGALKYSEQASLFWGRFTVQPLRNLFESFFHPSASARSGRFLFSIGYRYNTIAAYTYKERIRTRETVFRNQGPSAAISYTIGERLAAELSGWVENINRSLGNDLTQSNFTFRLRYKM